MCNSSQAAGHVLSALQRALDITERSSSQPCNARDGPAVSQVGWRAQGRGEGARAYQEGAQRQRQAGDLGEHAGAQHHQQRQRRKHVRVAHVGDAAVDGPQQRAPARDDYADAGYCLRARNSHPSEGC